MDLASSTARALEGPELIREAKRAGDWGQVLWLGSKSTVLVSSAGEYGEYFFQGQRWKTSFGKAQHAAWPKGVGRVRTMNQPLLLSCCLHLASCGTGLAQALIWRLPRVGRGKDGSMRFKFLPTCLRGTLRAWPEPLGGSLLGFAAEGPKQAQASGTTAARPDAVSYNAAITACARARRWPLALRVFAGMPRAVSRSETDRFSSFCVSGHLAERPHRSSELRWSNASQFHVLRGCRPRRSQSFGSTWQLWARFSSRRECIQGHNAVIDACKIGQGALWVGEAFSGF